MTRGLTKYAYLLCFFALVMTLQVMFGPLRVITIDIALAGLIACIVSLAISNYSELQFKWQRIDSTVVLILIAVTASTIMSENHMRSIAPYSDWLRVTLIYFISRSIGGSRVHPNFMSLGILALAVFLIFAGMVERVTGQPYFLIGNYVGGSTEQDISTVRLGGGIIERRISGTTTNPNTFGQWIIIFSTLALLELYRRRLYMYCIALALASILVIVFTAARAGLIAIILAAMIFLWLTREQIGNVLLRILLVTGFVLIGGIWFSEEIDFGRGMDIVLERFNRELRDRSLEQSNRVIVAKMGLDLLQRDVKYVAFGVGGDNFFPTYFKHASRASLQEERSGVHNVWLKCLTEYGIITMGALAAFFFQTLVLAFRSANVKRGRLSVFWGRFLIVLLLPYLLVTSQLYESALTYHALIPMFAFIGYSMSVIERESMIEMASKRKVVRYAPQPLP